ncbi:hypothetical protein Ancab_025074, partial [Ancistrocladus abbreviatus]
CYECGFIPGDNKYGKVQEERATFRTRGNFKPLTLGSSSGKGSLCCSKADATLSGGTGEKHPQDIAVVNVEDDVHNVPLVKRLVWLAATIQPSPLLFYPLQVGLPWPLGDLPTILPQLLSLLNLLSEEVLEPEWA